MREALSAFIRAQMGTDVEVVELRRIAVGHSRAMYRVACSDGARFVLRMEQGGVFGTSSTEEFAVMRWLWSVGVPVAKARWYEPTGIALGQPFFLMDFLDGAAAMNRSWRKRPGAACPADLGFVAMRDPPRATDPRI